MSDYIQQERMQLLRQLAGIESAPLVDRREARTEYTQAMRETPEIIAERVSWLLDGHYGRGAYALSHEIAQSRGNRVAGLAQLIAQLEWQCPAAFAREAWRRLSPIEQGAVNVAVAGVIVAWLREQEQEQAS